MMNYPFKFGFHSKLIMAFSLFFFCLSPQFADQLLPYMALVEFEVTSLDELAGIASMDSKEEIVSYEFFPPFTSPTNNCQFFLEGALLLLMSFCLTFPSLLSTREKFSPRFNNEASNSRQRCFQTKSTCIWRTSTRTLCRSTKNSRFWRRF